MNPLVKILLTTLSGPITGFITTYVMDLIDDGLKITAKLPDSVKQLAVVVIAALLPLIQQASGLSLPSDPTQLVNPTVVQSLIAAAFAFFIKHASTAKVNAPVASTPASK